MVVCCGGGICGRCFCYFFVHICWLTVETRRVYCAWSLTQRLFGDRHNSKWTKPCRSEALAFQLEDLHPHWPQSHFWISRFIKFVLTIDVIVHALKISLLSSSDLPLLEVPKTGSEWPSRRTWGQKSVEMLHVASPTKNSIRRVTAAEAKCLGNQIDWNHNWYCTVALIFVLSIEYVWIHVVFSMFLVCSLSSYCCIPAYWCDSDCLSWMSSCGTLYCCVYNSIPFTSTKNKHESSCNTISCSLGKRFHLFPCFACFFGSRASTPNFPKETPALEPIEPCSIAP